MLTSPQTVTINGAASTCNKVEENKNSSIYRTDDGNVSLTVSHQESKSRFRRMARIDKRIIAADPLTAVNAYQKLGVYVVIDEPTTGFADADIAFVVEALKTWLSGANQLALLASRH